MSRLIVVTGLPASGKTTVAAGLAKVLGLPLFDKDDILDALFDSLDTGSQSRSELSRASDEVLIRLVGRSGGAVICSFWRRAPLSMTSGTPTEWLTSLGLPVVEVYCTCPPEEAARRFTSRNRHPAHGDAAKNQPELIEPFQRLAALGPHGLGVLIEVDTTSPVDIEALAKRVRVARSDPA